MHWGDKEHQALFKAIREGGDKPHHADTKRPALRSDCIPYYDAFRLLGASRLWTQVGPSPIQVTEVRALLDLMGLDEQEEKLKYMRLIQRMDMVELEYRFEKAKK